MTKADTLVNCICCGQDKPAWDYPPGGHTCTLCSMLPVDQAVIKARGTAQREFLFVTQTKQGRKQARINAKLEKYKTTGKRCTACHHLKPAEAYNACEPQPDGLQPICRACNQVRAQLVKEPGGLALWHAVRDGLRKSSPEGK